MKNERPITTSLGNFEDWKIFLLGKTDGEKLRIFAQLCVSLESKRPNHQDDGEIFSGIEFSTMNDFSGEHTISMDTLEVVEELSAEEAAEINLENCFEYLHTLAVSEWAEEGIGKFLQDEEFLP